MTHGRLLERTRTGPTSTHKTRKLQSWEQYYGMASCGWLKLKAIDDRAGQARATAATFGGSVSICVTSSTVSMHG